MKPKRLRVYVRPRAARNNWLTILEARYPRAVYFAYGVLAGGLAALALSDIWPAN